MSATASLKSFRLRVQPMVHVAEMSAALSFYEALGARVVFGSRDGDWALIEFDGSMLSLLAHPPGDGNLETVELQFTCESSLEEVEAHMVALDPALIARGVAEEAFGRMLKLRSPDGLLIKVLELQRNRIQ